ncbi:MAG TPA: type II toxin-antitoxin system RelE/ParE family toxin [Lysobacter sp.]|jgi:plasmid stabilization system protein ParE|nr:type II toxin-antitoxin system RelE/ParE family toxin [Lysobacter sp.]
MRVIIDESAWSDLDTIALRIARDDAAAARREVEKIRHVIGLLGELPALSRDGRAKGTRERVVPGGRYVVVFEMWEKPRALVVTGIVHAARNR